VSHSFQVYSRGFGRQWPLPDQFQISFDFPDLPPVSFLLLRVSRAQALLQVGNPNLEFHFLPVTAGEFQVLVINLGL